MLFSVLSIMMATSANAGLLEALGLTKKAEPTTLAEACDTAEIKKVCPEILLGTKTVTECLAENVKSLSTQCANFVKKSIVEKKDALTAAASGVEQDGADAKEGLVGAVKQKVADKKAEAAAKVEADKAAAAQKQAAARDAAQGLSDSLKQTGQDVRETGAAIKALF